jgi:hypothetical protein
MQEAFLHFLWKYRHLPPEKLFTLNGEPIRIVKTGTHNTDAGPDFQHAELMIGDTRWAGNIEVHLRTSDWDKHGHSTDPRYDNVILHVVYDHDKNIAAKQNIPVLKLRDAIPSDTYQTYLELNQASKPIPCHNHIAEVGEFVKDHWLERVMVERLARKAMDVQAIFKATRNDWEETAYRVLARSFGFKVNNEAFLALASKLPLKLLQKYTANNQVEALLFGQAGFLSGAFVEDYPNALKKEFDFLAKKHNLKPISYSHWKLLRLHPANFPTLRIAQFADFIQLRQHLFSHFLEIKEAKGAHQFLSVEASEYWKKHYFFDKPSPKPVPVRLAESSRVNIIINTISPLLFAYGQERNSSRYKERAIQLLQSLPPEGNKIIRLWEDSGIKAPNAAVSQALLELSAQYCKPVRCLECGIGAAILGRKKR